MDLSSASAPRCLTLQKKNRVRITALFAEYAEQKAHLFGDFRRSADRARNFPAQQFSVTLTQTMHGHGDRALAHLQPGSGRRISASARFAGQINLEFLELRCFSGRLVISFELA